MEEYELPKETAMDETSIVTELSSSDEVLPCTNEHGVHPLRFALLGYATLQVIIGFEKYAFNICNNCERVEIWDLN